MADKAKEQVQDQAQEQANGVWFTLPNTVGFGEKARPAVSKPFVQERKDGSKRDMVCITLAQGMEIPMDDGKPRNVSYDRIFVSAKSVKQNEKDPSYVSVFLPTANKEGEPFNIDIIYNRREQNPETGEWLNIIDDDGNNVTGRFTVSAEKFAQAAEALRDSRRDYVQNKRVEAFNSRKHAAPNTPVVDNTPAAESKGTLADKIDSASKASEAVAAETPKKDEVSLSLDDGVALG